MLWTTWVCIGALMAALSVMSGAFGAHALQRILEPASLTTWETASRYHMYHALALIACGLLGTRIDNNFLHSAAVFFILGIICFSFSLYGYAFSQIRWLAMVTPVGGGFFIVAWILLAIAVKRGF